MREVSKLNDIFDLESPELLATEPIKDLFFLIGSVVTFNQKDFCLKQTQQTARLLFISSMPVCQLHTPAIDNVFKILDYLTPPSPQSFKHLVLSSSFIARIVPNYLLLKLECFQEFKFLREAVTDKRLSSFGTLLDSSRMESFYSSHCLYNQSMNWCRAWLEIGT